MHRRRMRHDICRALILVSGVALGLAQAPALHAHQDGAQEQSAQQGFADVDALLDAIEVAEQDLRALWCEVVYDRRFVLQGDRQIRFGTLEFVRTPADDENAEDEKSDSDTEEASRAFEVEFKSLIIDDEVRDERQAWAFKDRWLVERRFDKKVYVKRELAPPGKTLDPMRLGQGPIPLPIGQRKDDILARYTPTLEDPADGFDLEDGSEAGYADYVHDAVQLKLVPKADVPGADEKFREIRLWYKVSEDGTLIPYLARTVDRSRDVVFVQLVGVQQGETLPEGKRISLEEPDPDEGWDIQIERGRFDEDLDSVRIGEAFPTSTVQFATYAHPMGQEGPPQGDPNESGGLREPSSWDSDASDIVEEREGAARWLESVSEREPNPMDAPDTSETVLRAIGAGYLTDEERADRRIFHGLWTNSDLEERPGATAKGALQLGVWDHLSFEDALTEPLDRIEALIRRGDLTLALDELGPEDDRPRAIRLRGEALEGLGRFEEAVATLAPLREALESGRLKSAQDITDGARATWIHSRLTGEADRAYQTMVTQLTQAHQAIDRLYWPAILLEAQLLESKGNAQESTQAASQVLEMSTAAAEAWSLLGIRSVRGFASENALRVADRLTKLERRLADDRAHSPTGDLVAARMYLRLNDPELAERHVERVLARYPRHREALALRAAVAATRYDYAALEEHLSAFDQLSPGHPLALYEAGNALSERRQYEEASAYLNRAVERMPTWAEPLVELGLMEVQAARDLIARDVLRKAVELDPFHTRAINSLALVEGLLDEFETVESEHFIVRYKPGIDKIMASEMLADLETMHDDISAQMGHVPTRKTLVEVMPDHAWFSVRITGMPQIHTIAAATGPIVAMEAPKIGKGHTGVYDWLRVMRHEYTHTVTLDRTGNRIPLWHTEAAAVEMETSPRDYNTVRLLANALATNTLFDLDEINLGFIRPEKPSDRSQAYAQANWMWRFIDDTWGNEANLEMMDRFASGERVPQVLDEMFDITQRDFMDRFRAWAWEDARTWGVFPEPSIEALRLEETQADEVMGTALDDELARFARNVSRSTITGEAVTLAQLELLRVSPDLVDFWAELYPDHPGILELLVKRMLSDRLGEPRLEDAPLLLAYAEARPTDPAPHRHLARLYLRSDDPERAIPHLEYLDDREVYSPAYTVALARRYAERGEYERAMAAAERATRIAPFDGDHRELAATVALQNKDYRGAMRHIEALVTLEPNIEQHKRRLEALRKLMDTADAG